MTESEIIEKKISLTQNDIDHYNRMLNYCDGEIMRINKMKREYQQKIGKKQVYRGFLENDLEKLNP